MKRKLLLVGYFVAAVGVVATMSGCAVEQGRRVESTDVSFIQKGKTTKSELVEKLGPPTETAVDSNGRESVTWEYFKSTSDGKTFIPIAGFFVGSQTFDSATFTAFLDAKSRVVDYKLSSGRSQGRLGNN